MGEEEGKECPDTILYELSCCGEWRDEREEKSPLLLPNKPTSGAFSYLNPLKLLGRKRQLTVAERARLLKGVGPPWQVALSPNGNVVAILQNCILETRCSKDNFMGPMSRTNVLKDPHPECRVMTWSLDSQMVAISFSNGQIIFYDNMAVQLFSVRRYALPSQEEASASLFSSENVLAGLLFSRERVKKYMYPNEVISVDLKGIIKCFRQSSADQMTFHHDSSSLRNYYTKGVHSVVCAENSGVLIVCGNLESESGEQSKADLCHKYGISVWRLLNDAPHYSIVFTLLTDRHQLDSRKTWSLGLSTLFGDKSKIDDVVFKLSLSPNQKYLAAAHTSGTISVWHVPSLKCYRSWPLKNQFHHWTENPRFNNRWRIAYNRWNEEPIDDWRFHTHDVNWWSDNIIIASRTNGCVSLFPIDEEVPSRNMLGGSPECFESPVYVTPRKCQGFLTLECEFKLKTDERKISIDENAEDAESSEAINVELLDAYDSQFLPKTVIQEVLFWMTDFERFRPPRKRKRKPPVWYETHRIFWLRNITPQELLHQRIEANEFGEALDVARAYKLDSDLVYQRQWSKSEVSVTTIKDYLGKIKKRSWVLQECLERVPPTAEAARALLNFGLSGTDISAAVLISQERDKGLFQLLKPDDLEMSKEDYLMLIDGNNLEVQRLLSYRKQFLYYLDILDTYELIVGGPSIAEENFKGEEYAALRSRTPLASAIEMAKASDIAALKIMLRHHWADIAAQYLTVLSSFPESTCPHDYSEFLPEVKRNGDVLLWSDYEVKERDWCERFLNGMYKRSLSLTSNVIVTDVEAITHWYEDRVREVEKMSGITSYALDLAKLGVQRNVPDIEHLVKDLEVVEIMVYDAKVNVNLDQLEELCPIDRLYLLMSNTTEKNFMNHMREYVVPFLDKCEKQEKGSRFHILEQYLSSISASDLSKTLQVFENSLPGSVDPIISDNSELMLIACNCIYACNNPNQTDNVIAILNCLPEKHQVSNSSSSNLKILFDRIDELELHYQGVKILSKYEIEIPLQQLKEMATDEGSTYEVEMIFRNICDAGRKMKTAMKVTEWKTLLFDVLDLQKKVFKSFPIERCFEMYVEAVLRSGAVEVISLAHDFIDHQPVEEDSSSSPENFKKLMRRVSSAYSTTFALYLYLIPYSQSLEMVLQTALHYFDSASNYMDPDIELCKACLNLMQNPKEPEISKIYDLIDAVKIINKDFNLNVLPQNVRLVRNKKGLLQQCMDNIPDGYTKMQLLLKVAVLLKFDDEYNTIAEIESWLCDICGEAALLVRDVKFCIKICENIMAKEYESGWKIFVETAKYQSDPPIMNHETRLCFINYALNMCPNDQILNVLNSKHLIEIRSLQSKVTELSPENSDLDPSLLDVPEEDETIPDSLNPEKLKEFLSTTSGWINPLKDVANVVTGTLLNPTKLAGITSRLISESTGTNISHDTSFQTANDDEPNSTFMLESYPYFYLSKDELRTGFFHQSLLASKYDSFASSLYKTYTGSNPALELCITLNRIWHCERSLLGEEDCGKRDEGVLEQLVVQILPEDISWGFAILFSITDINVLKSVLSKLPVTPVSCTVILYFLSLLISKEMDRLQVSLRKDPNVVICQTRMFVESDKPSEDEEEEDETVLTKLFSLFRHYEEALKDCMS